MNVIHLHKDLISVIVPVYNLENYLVRCLDSIANQSFHDLEILLIDDGSTDSSGSICDDYSQKDSRFKVIHQKNQGVSKARNTGLRLATGNFIAFVDSDDYIHPRMFEILYNVLRGRDVPCSMCFGERVFNLSEDDIQSFESIGDYQSGLLSCHDAILALFGKDRISYVQYALVWNKLFKREAVDGLSFHDMRISEDTDFMMRLYVKYKEIVVIDKSLYYWVQRPSSATHTNKLLNLADEVKSYSRFLDYFNTAGFFSYKEEVVSAYLLRLYRKMVNIRYLSYGTDLQEYVAEIVKSARKLTQKSYFQSKGISFSEKWRNIIKICFPNIYYLVRKPY